MTKRSRGEGSIFLRGKIWWVAHRAHGRQVQESTRSTSERAAVKKLRQRLGELATNTFTGPDAEKVTFEDLVALLKQDYTLKERRSARRMDIAAKRLAEHFAGQRAMSITAASILDYQVRRRQKAAAATVAFELACLRRAFNLAVGAEILPRRPKFPTLTVNNARQGFLDLPQVDALCKELPDYLAPVARFAFYTGWRRQGDRLT